MAAQRTQHKRKRRRSRLGPLFKLLCAVAVMAAVTLGATVFFQVETIVVTGNQRYTQEEVIRATGIQVGDNLFRMNKYQIYDQVCESLPYVEDILIRRGLPSTILVTITEWDAVAQVLPAENGTQAVTVEATDTEEAGETPQTPAVAVKPWLISVGGKLLEEAPAGSTAMEVSGVTLLMPRAGTQMAIPEEQQVKQDALLSLLRELDGQEMLADVSRVELKSTEIELEYLGRYRVKLPLDCDFGYKLQALDAAVTEREQALGSSITGTFDLAQKNYTAVYSPD